MASQGRARRWWPSSPAHFVDTTVCPACFAPLRGPVCGRCGLDVSVPESAELYRASQSVLQAEEQRQLIIERMRATQLMRYPAAPRSAHDGVPPIAPTAVPAVSGVRSAASAPLPGAVPVTQPEPSPASAPGASEGRRRSGIQILLLSVGVVLVSVAAIFFLVLAYLIASLEIRSVLTAAIGLIVIAVTALLRRRRLVATAEGVGVVAVVFLLLDVWIVRANALWGSADLPAWWYSAVGLAIVAVLLITARIFARVRAFSVAGALIGAAALFCAGVASFPNAGAGSRAWVGTVLVAAAGLVWPLLRPHRAENIAVRSIAAVGSALALAFAAAAWPSFDWGTSVAFLITCAAMTAHLWISPVAREGARAGTPVAALRPPGDDASAVRAVAHLGAWKTAAAVAVGLAVAGAATAPAVNFASAAAQLTVPAALSALGAVVLAVTARLTRRSVSSPGLVIAADIVLVVCGLASVPGAGLAAVTGIVRIAIPNFSVDPLTPLPPVFPEVEASGPIVLAALTIALAISLALVRRHRLRLGWLPLATGTLAIAAAGVVAPAPLAGTGILAALAIASTALFATLKPRRGRRAVLSAGVIGACVLGFAIGANSSGTWPFAAIISLGCLIAYRSSIGVRVRPADRGALAPVVTVVLVALAILTARWTPIWLGSLLQVDPGVLPAFAMVVLAAVGIAAASALDAQRSRADSSIIVSLSGIAAVLGIVELASPDPSGVPYNAIALGLLLAAQFAWQLPRVAADRIARYATAVLIPPTAVLTAVELWRRFGPSVWGATELIAAGVCVVLAGLGILLFRSGRRAADGSPRTHPARLGWDAAIALTSVITVPAALSSSEFGPLNLVLLGLLPLLFSAGEGDIVRGSSPRRHLAWVSLPWFIAALWLGLAREDVSIVEAYTFPIAVALTAVLAIILWRHPHPQPAAPSGRNMLAVAALATAALPSLAAASVPQPTRALALVGIGAAAALLSPALPPLWRGVRLGLWLWSAGVLMSVIAGTARAFGLVADAEGDVPVELWLIPVALTLTAAGVLWRGRRLVPAVLSPIVVAAAPAVLAIPFANLVVVSPVAPWRITLMCAVVIGYFVAASAAREPRRTVAVRWTATASAAFLAIGAVAGGVDPLEAATLPLGAGAIIGGVLRLRRDPTARSWRHLGVGVAVLLLPSLLFDMADTALWRVVGLGVVSLAILIWGARSRLQAPTVIAAAVLVVHALAQLWPWISAVYSAVPWWLWAGIGGVVLIVIAATYEKRIRDLKAVAERISALR